MIAPIRSYFNPIMKRERQRVRLARSTSLPKAIRPIVASCVATPEMDVSELDYLCIDFETTGLDLKKDQILSIGMVEITKGGIDLSSASHTYIKGTQAIKGETAVINHIVPETLADGVSLDEAMEQLFKQMQGKVILVHGLNIEQGFILRYLTQTYNIQYLPWIWIDTMRLERTMLENQMNPQGTSYQLNMLRERYDLPDYTGHNALTDAISTAELYFAQLPKIYGKTKPRLCSEVIKRSL